MGFSKTIQFFSLLKFLYLPPLILHLFLTSSYGKEFPSKDTNLSPSKFFGDLSENLRFHIFTKEESLETISSYGENFSSHFPLYRDALKTNSLSDSQSFDRAKTTLTILGLLRNKDFTAQVTEFEKRFPKNKEILPYVWFFFHRTGNEPKKNLNHLFEISESLKDNPVDHPVIFLLGFSDSPEATIPRLFDLRINSDGASAELISLSISWIYHFYPDKTLKSLKTLYSSGSPKVRKYLLRELQFISAEGNKKAQLLLEELKKQ